MVKRKTKKELLMESALDVFMERGFEKATIDDIVNKAGCGKGTFYRYFSNKESLFAELDANFQESLGETLKENCQPELSPRDYLLAGLKSFVETFTKHNKVGMIRFERDLRLNAEERKESCGKIMKHFFHMRSYIDKAQMEGKMKPFNAETIITTIIGSAHFLLFREFKLGIIHTTQELEETVDIIFHGVKSA